MNTGLLIQKEYRAVMQTFGDGDTQGVPIPKSVCNILSNRCAGILKRKEGVLLVFPPLLTALKNSV